MGRAHSFDEQNCLPLARENCFSAFLLISGFDPFPHIRNSLQASSIFKILLQKADIHVGVNNMYTVYELYMCSLCLFYKICDEKCITEVFSELVKLIEKYSWEIIPQPHMQTFISSILV